MGFSGLYFTPLPLCQGSSKPLPGVALLHLCREKPQSNLQPRDLGFPWVAFSGSLPNIMFYAAACWDFYLGEISPRPLKGWGQGRCLTFKRSAISVQAWKAKAAVAQSRTQCLRTAMEKILIKTLEAQINDLCHLGLKSDVWMPIWSGSSPETCPVMSSHSLSPRSRLGSVSAKKELQNLPLLCAGISVACAMLFALSFPLTLSAPPAALRSPVPSSVKGKYNSEDGIPFTSSNLSHFHWWQVLEWILC